MARDLIESIRDEYVRYKALGDATIQQMRDDDLSRPAHDEGNSVATIVWHVSGNLKSRFTDFLTSDGEKPWRHRDEEFERRHVTREELVAKWAEGWDVLFATLATLSDDQLSATVMLRQQPLRVHEALHRSLAHAAYHVGQIVFLGKMFQGAGWKYLSIPPGGSAAYNQKPTTEKPAAHAEAMRRLT